MKMLQAASSAQPCIIVPSIELWILSPTSLVPSRQSPRDSAYECCINNGWHGPTVVVIKSKMAFASILLLMAKRNHC